MTSFMPLTGGLKFPGCVPTVVESVRSLLPASACARAQASNFAPEVRRHASRRTRRKHDVVVESTALDVRHSSPCRAPFCMACCGAQEEERNHDRRVGRITLCLSWSSSRSQVQVQVLRARRCSAFPGGSLRTLKRYSDVDRTLCCVKIRL